jgi:hypothetical protein
MKLLKSLAVMLLTASMFSGCMMMVPTRTVTTTNYENPQWAPPYYSGARYYYLPDLELYYDLGNREYIFLMNGRWHFSPYLPAIYGNYDLDNSFCIVMNVDVYRPWLHHQYYVSHYPRYYYRDYYDRSNIPYVRAYNENLRRAIYWNDNERSRARPWNDDNLRDNRRFKYSEEDRREQKNRTQTTQQQNTFGGESRGGQQNNTTQTRTTTRTETNTPARPETRTRAEETPQNRTSTQTETRTRTETTPQTRTSTRNETETPATTRTTTTTTRQTSTNNEAAPVRNNQTNYYGKTIGNSVRVTKEMKDNAATPATRSARQTEKSR